MLQDIAHTPKLIFAFAISIAISPAAAALTITSNNSGQEISGTVSNSASDPDASYDDGNYSDGTALDSNFAPAPLAGSAAISWASSSANAATGLQVLDLGGDYSIGGSLFADASLALAPPGRDTADGDAYADAFIDLAFTLASSFTVILGTGLTDAYAQDGGFFSVGLYDGASAPLYEQMISDASQSLQYTALLAPGDYTLSFAAGADAVGITGAGMAGGDFLMNFSAIPVPAAIWLFGSGLIALLSLSRRHR